MSTTTPSSDAPAVVFTIAGDLQVDHLAELLLSDDLPTCEQCGNAPATHRHQDTQRSADRLLCDACCDKNCRHFVTAYRKAAPGGE